MMLLSDNEIIRMKKAVKTESELLLHLGEWLTHLNMFSDAQIYAILDFVKDEVISYENQLRQNGDVPVRTVAVTDNRWVSISTKPVLFDTQTTEISNEPLSQFAVTHIICDIAALYRRMLHRDRKSDA